ncbi:MAG: helix-turn-helix transcriptional regulator [Bacilli bacterium]|nr:helix-turn-helix transcriptional regulator [Bacilli bacterium]MBO4682696.1 helix-turn-helix transcriptional regulator [Bacilli bacterium]
MDVLKNYYLPKVRELFCRLFVVAINERIHPNAFAFLLGKSEYVNEIENKHYDKADSTSLEELFFSLTKMELHEDNSFGVYNDVYWCGYTYFELHLRTKKPFSYLFLKLPLNRLLDMYPLYHEMDITQVENYIANREDENTIIKLLCKKKLVSMTKLSSETGISINTIKKYAASDTNLYAASFQNLTKIARFFDVPLSLFVEEL